jgi:pyrroline-5-carboxylate reductase
LSSLESRIAAAAGDSLTLVVAGVEEAALEAGMTAEVVGSLARQVLEGTAVVLGSGLESPAVLKDRVAAPAGTTIQGLAVLEDRAVRGALIRAVQSAAAGEEKGRSK